MKLTEAINSIDPVRGVSSVIGAIMSGDLSSIAGKSVSSETLGLIHARAELEKVRKAQDECKSDHAYWGYQGDVSYWRAVISLMEAAEITGAGNLPDIPYVPRGGVVMDLCANQERWGQRVLEAARESPHPLKPPYQEDGK